jgi:hypothetical protein
MTASHRFEPFARTESPSEALPQPHLTPDLTAAAIQKLDNLIASNPATAAVLIDTLWSHAPALYDLVKRLAALDPEQVLAAALKDGGNLTTNFELTKLVAIAQSLVAEIHAGVQL